MRTFRVAILLVAALFVLAACNLGANNAPDPTSPVPDVLDPQYADDGTIPEDPTTDGATALTDIGADDTGTTDLGTTDDGTTDEVTIPPTDAPETTTDAPQTSIQSITVDGSGFVTQEPVTIRVQRGTSVSSLNCSITLQETGEAAPLSAATTTQVSDQTFEEVFTYTPDRAGTYTVTCNGFALTDDGQQTLTESSDPFTVEAKG
ncbi:MAG: hypothetical protein ACFB51_01145 [Anaerolineae bacterium]